MKPFCLHAEWRRHLCTQSGILDVPHPTCFSVFGWVMPIFVALVVPPTRKIYAVKSCQTNVWVASPVSFKIIIKYLVVTRNPCDFMKRDSSGDSLNLCILICAWRFAELGNSWCPIVMNKPLIHYIYFAFNHTKHKHDISSLLNMFSECIASCNNHGNDAHQLNLRQNRVIYQQCQFLSCKKVW